ncbi:MULTISPECIES: phosphoadenylyl-sulfate reductase [unclassified Knoellia]|uniref:phosphoadenylyl-sulfate reductase n=1 Tax=Knoellia altitudinis TaxID=3404795 RepID=UPI00360DB96B
MSTLTRRTTRRSEEELRALALEGSQLDDTDAAGVARWAAANFHGTLAVACSMAEGVLPHLISQDSPGVDVLFLETGYHFSDTIGTRARVADELDVNVVDVLPQRTVAEQDAEFGARLYERDPAACCAMRKMEPLARTLAGYEAWVTGVRRDEAPTRTATPLVTFDEKHGLVKINPLVTWSLDDVTDYALDHGVPINLLLSDGFPSIGCEPCTKRVAPGEDPRSGRWAGLSKTECGIHT